MNEFKTISPAEFLSLNPVKKLDFILMYLNSIDKYPELPSDICTAIFSNNVTKDNVSLLTREIKKICEHLKCDGYVIEQLKEEDCINVSAFMISFDGSLLIENQNGYQQLEMNNIRLHQKQKMDLWFQRCNIFALSVATIVIALEPLYRILKHYHILFH